jgi:hypothetical protein
MTCFIQHRNGAVAIDHIAALARSKEIGVWEIETKDGKLLKANASDVNGTIVEMLPGDGCELLGFNPDSRARPRNWYAEPIVAFARTVLGDVRPITLARLALEPYGSHVVRRKGSPMIYEPSRGKCWEDANAWLDDMQVRFDAGQDERAAEHGKALVP